MNQRETHILQACISVLLLLLNQSERANYDTEKASEEEKRTLTLLIGEAKELCRKSKKELNCSELYFTKKEYTEMPILKDCTVRLKPNGITEIRYRRNGIAKSFSSKDPKEARRKARAYLKGLSDKLKRMEDPKSGKERQVLLFRQFAQQWLTVEKFPYLKEITYQSYRNNLEKHVFPAFGEKDLQAITYIELQEFINGYIEAGRYRTAKKLRNLLQQIFKSAAEQEIISKSPAVRLKEVVYEAKNGQALTKKEEREFVNSALKSDLPFKYALLLILYTGIRRDELKHVTFNIDRSWITVKNGKTKKGKSSERRIPVSPMLKKFIFNVTDEDLRTKNDQLSKAVSLLTDKRHHLHELRHTFITRCQECEIPAEIVSRWVGHSRGNNTTDRVYTHFSDDFQLKMIEKFDY